MRGSVSLQLDTSFLWDIKRCSTNLYDVVTLVPSLLVLVTKSERRSRSDVLLWDSCAMRVWIWIMWILYIVCIPFMWSMFKIYHREDKKSDLTCHECQPCPPLTVSPGATTNKTLLTQINVAFSYECTSAGCCWLVDRWTLANCSTYRLIFYRDCINFTAFFAALRPAATDPNTKKVRE